MDKPSPTVDRVLETGHSLSPPLTCDRPGYPPLMRSAVAGMLVFVAGFIIMVLEIVGARFLARDFGNSFHVWVSQIGVVLIALALGYFLGGALADRWQRLWVLVLLLVP